MNRNHAKITNHRRTIARDVTDRTLFIHFISENEIIYILMYFIGTRQLGLEPESARKDKQTSNKISNKLPVRALNKLLNTKAGDISPYFLRELIAIMRT